MAGGRLYGPYYASGSVERAQDYWLKNYQWAEDEYLDRNSGTIKKMEVNEVRLKDGSKTKVDVWETGWSVNSTGLSDQQFRRAEAIAKKKRSSDPNIVNGYEFRMGEFGVEYRGSPETYAGNWAKVHDMNTGELLAAASEWMKRKVIKLGD